MKFSSPANIALASIALSSPNLLSSPVLVNAAPTGDAGSLSPNLGAGHFGNSPRMHATDSPVMPTMASPPTSKIAGRRRSLRRSRSIRRRKEEKSSRNIDPLGLGMSAGDIQSGAESILHPRMAPPGLLFGTPGAVDPFSPIVGPGGLIANTGLVPPNTPMLGGDPLAGGVDPATLLGAIPTIIPAPGINNVIPTAHNSVTTGASGALSPVTAGSLPFVDGVSPVLGAAPVSPPQVPGALTPVTGNLPQLPGGFSPLAGGIPSVPGVSSEVPGALPLASGVPQVSGVSQAQAGSLPVAAPGANGLTFPTVLSSPGASPNVLMPPPSGTLPQAPGPVAGASKLVGGVTQIPGSIQIPDAVPHFPAGAPQVSGITPQVPGGTGGIPQVPGVVPQLPVDPLSKANPGLPTPSLAGTAPVPIGSGIPLVSPAEPVTGLAVPTGSLAVPAISIVPFSSVMLPTSVSILNALPSLLPNSNSLPASTVTSLPAQPIESLAPPDPLTVSNSIPHILVSRPDSVGVFEPLEGIGAGAMGRPEDDGAQTESTRPENGIRPMESGEFDGSGMSGKDEGTQTTSDTKSAAEPRTTSWSASQSEPTMEGRTTSEPIPTNMLRPGVKVDVPTTTEFFTSKPTPADAHITASQAPTPRLDEEILPVWKRWEPKSPSLPIGVGSHVTDESGSPLLSEGAPVPTSSVYVLPTARLRVPSQDSLSVSRSASMVTLKSFSMASITESLAPIQTPAQTASPMIGGIRSSMDMAQPTGLIPTISDDSLSSHSSSDERPLHVSPTAATVASSPVVTLYTGGAPLSRTFGQSVDTPSSVVAISGDSPNMPSPTLLGSGTSTDSQDKATRKIFRWGVPKMVTSTIRSVATAVKK